MLKWYKKCETAEFSPIGRDLDKALAAAGFVREESGKDTHCGTFHDLEICRMEYASPGGERVFLITHLPEKAACTA